MRRGVIFFIVGCFLGSIGDYFHKVFGITVYPSQNLFHHQIPGTPLWTMLLFGSGGVAMCLGYQWFKNLHKYVKRVNFRRRSTAGHALVGAVLFLAIYALSAVIGQWPAPFPDLSLAAASLVFWEIYDGTIGGLLFAVAVSIIGTSVEIILVHEGFFFYGTHIHKLFGVASWLPWIYVSAAIAATETGSLFKRSLTHQKPDQLAA